MALGAQWQDVLRLVMRESMVLVAIGVTVGLAIAIAAGRLVATLLFGLPPTDVMTIVVAVGTDGGRLSHRRLHPGPARVESRPDGGAALRVKNQNVQRSALTFRVQSFNVHGFSVHTFRR